MPDTGCHTSDACGAGSSGRYSMPKIQISLLATTALAKKNIKERKKEPMAKEFALALEKKALLKKKKKRGKFLGGGGSRK